MPSHNGASSAFGARNIAGNIAGRTVGPIPGAGSDDEANAGEGEAWQGKSKRSWPR